MKLYMVPAAPNPTKVMLYIAEKTAAGTEMDVEQVLVNTLKNEQKSAEHLARNPFGSLPVLEVADKDYMSNLWRLLSIWRSAFPNRRCGGMGRANAYAPVSWNASPISVCCFKSGVISTPRNHLSDFPRILRLRRRPGKPCRLHFSTLRMF